jgi:cytochrome c551/c552
MHLVFGGTALLMLVCTLWMLAADHNREWKDYQRKFRDVETWTANSRIDEQDTSDFEARSAELRTGFEETLAEAPDPALVDEFDKEAKPRAKQNGYNLGRIETAEQVALGAQEDFSASRSRLTAARQKLDAARKNLEKATAAAQSAPDDAGKKNAASEAAQAKKEIDESEKEIKQVREESEPRRNALVKARREVFAAMDTVLRIAKQDEENLTVALKAKRADLDVVKSEFDLGVARGNSPENLKKLEVLQEKVYEIDKGVASLDLQVQEAKTHRMNLQNLIVKINTRQDVALKEYEDHRSTLVQLEKARTDREVNFWKRALALPIIDAFGRPLKIEQIWLPTLTLNNNFKDVARFDRCTTCHQAIDRTAPGSAVEPGYDTRESVILQLATPAEAPQAPASLEKDKDAQIKYLLKEAYGLELSQRGLFAQDDVTIEVVWPRTLGAKAGLQPGDIIRYIGKPDPIDPGQQIKIVDKQRAVTYLLESVTWGQPLTLQISRGLPHPYSSHPRLDLFVGSLSPHKMNDVGCTICHDGQGSATAFQWASHTPNTPGEADKWKKEHGWFNNHHWIFPMLPTRFAESSCLKCHFDVTELEPSDRFPDPPAPKLTKGHDLIRQYGCFGCHEINGFDGPNRRRGPDMRTEPMYFAAAAQLLMDPGLDNEQKKLAREVIAHPELDEPRRLLAESIRSDAAQSQSGDKAHSSKLLPTSQKLATIIGADDVTPGQLRKVGPSLRHVASKVDKAFLYDWVKEPKHFRPTTKMPQFFGLFDHLVPELANEDGKLVMKESRGLAEAKRFEPVEIRAVAEYLLSASQPFEYVKPSDSKAESASVERGKFMFQTRGCLACHQHADFPDAHDKQGPNLTGLGGKLDTSKGKQWLYSWVREPNRYHSRTVMPNLFLEPIKGADGKTTDPAADITEYLLQSKSAQPDGKPWEPVKMPEVDASALDDLVLTFLRAVFTEEQSKKYLTTGIPEDRRAELKGDEVVLVGINPLTAEKKLQYVGRRTISRLGCAGCHDIPSYEDAKPIGTGLADWGRKETSKLAFEQIIEYLTETNGGQHGHTHGEHGSAHGEAATEASDHHGLNPRELDKEPGLEGSGYYFQALLNHEREGFIWQKIREPRSYDFKKTENKKYTDRLRMPQFNLTADEREAIITFVLGLVAEPPAAKYVYKAAPRRQAELNGQKLLTKYNCSGCHTTKMGSWTFNYDPASPPVPGDVVDYPFLSPHFSPQEIEESKKVDRRGLGVATVTGMKGPEDFEDDDGKPIYLVVPWKAAVIDGKVWWPGKQAVQVPAARLEGSPRPPVGGEFARMLQPLAFVEGKKSVANALPDNAWGWVPPPLVGEGKKVLTGWLHDFLLDPYPIRPAVMLRMPKFNMSSAEASQLANYFAAVDGAEFPYEFKPRIPTESLASESSPQRERLDLALKVVTSNTYCVQCHKVGDFTPNQPSGFGMAPNLAAVQQRLRPEYLREWIASPKTKIPYTTMPDNIPYKNKGNEPTEVQKILGGSTEEQVQTVVDFLLNYDRYMEGKTSIKPLVKPAASVPQPAAANGGK